MRARARVVGQRHTGTAQHATPHPIHTLSTHTASTGGAPIPLGGLLSKLDFGVGLISGAGRGARDKLAGGIEAVLGALLDNNLGDNSFLKPPGVFGE